MFLEKVTSIPNRAWKSILADNAKLLDLAIRIAAISFLIDDLLEFRSYIRDLHIYLPSPVLPAINALPPWSDWAFLFLHIGGLVFLIWRPRLHYAAILVLSITVRFVLGDLPHLQPFVIMYSFTVLMAALPRVSDENRLQALRLMVIGVYFWAGFNKLNNSFYVKLFPLFINPLWSYPPSHPFINLVVFGISLTVPVCEALIGIFLLFDRTRVLATVMAAIMLVTVLACLGPFGHNRSMVVWPWNIYLFVLELYLFFAPHEIYLASLWESWPARLAAFFFIIAPFFGIWHLWGSLPSFKLYSANIVEADVVLDKRENVARLPEEIRLAMDFLVQVRQLNGMCTVEDNNIVPVYEWAAPFNMSNTYPSDYVYRTGAKGLCAYLQYPASAILRIRYPGEFDSLHVEETSEPLCPAAAPQSR